jgi:uroporphyrin-III C-methyltransferase/precorrin-2 dehydrogenase/sirohydrochlorin ferrochelatase/uroporphyrin-III C-methyltransferase
MSQVINMVEKKHLFALGVENRRAFMAGEVVLVGAGPGDPELLTVRAHNIIREANCVVYDRLVSEEIMALVDPQAEKVYVGKQCSDHALPQEKINELLIDKARQGLKVARLKGGDPFIFGRGGEEVQTLLKAGIACRVVPGVTSASACTTYSGIPLTHRDFVHGCTFVTGHFQNEVLDLPWDALAREDHTLVVYMGIKTAPVLAEQLMKHGLAGSIPVALISNGTTANHQTLRTTLAALPAFIQQHSIKPPTLIVVGKVVNALDESLAQTLVEATPEKVNLRDIPVCMCKQMN